MRRRATRSPARSIHSRSSTATARSGSGPASICGSALVAVAAFTALKLDQVKKFGESALNMGLSRTEVIEAVIQTAPLSGFAPALNALGALSGVLGGK